jgi:hypothetical protein
MAVLALPRRLTAPEASRSVPLSALHAAFLRRRDDAGRLREVARRQGQIVTVHKYVVLKPKASSRVSGEPGRS